MNLRNLVFFLGLLCISSGKEPDCTKTWLVVPDNFSCVLTAEKHWVDKSGSRGKASLNTLIVFLKNGTLNQNKKWPQLNKRGDGSIILYPSPWHIRKGVEMKFLKDKCSSSDVLKNKDAISNHAKGECYVSLNAKICEQSVYDENHCNNIFLPANAKHIIKIGENVTCLNCKNPVQLPAVSVEVSELSNPDNQGVPPSAAANLMKDMSNLASSIKESSAEITVGGKVLGVLVKEPDPEEIKEVSFGYKPSNDSMSIIDSQEKLLSFSRSITVPKEAFEQSLAMNVTEPFAAVMRFDNLTTGGMDSEVLGNEVIAIEMGAQICNLTNHVSINFQNLTYKGIPSCQSWNGEGRQMNWTDAGCQTITNGSRLSCRCSHMTFFAILLTPLNETISSYDLNTLTIITQVGCGVSMFFLCIVLYMHFFLRKVKPSKGTRILIHLVSAMFMLNLSFLVNSHVARLRNQVGCRILAAVMHYFLLATFSWFAVQAFHLCLQLYSGGKIAIHRYMLKVSITSWALPSVAVITLLIIGKYGESLIHISDSGENVAMCWITDSGAHYVINIGYYALVFLFTLTTFIIILSWLFCNKKMNKANTQMNSSCKTVGIVFGLCCLLGITWGFAFFAYGIFQIPSYYIFTILNSFQGFFLFIFYYNISRTGETDSGKMGSGTTATTSSSTLNTGLDYFENPYGNIPDKK